MVPQHIGKIILSSSTELRFEISPYKGRTFLNIRQFVDSARYTGPTQKGIVLSCNCVLKVLESLEKYKQNLTTSEENIIARIEKNRSTDIVIQIIPPDDKFNNTRLDVREFVESERYTGWTKKGFRLPLENLEDVINYLKESIKNFDTDLPLFSNGSEIENNQNEAPDSANGKGLIKEILKGEVPCFPDEFLSDCKNFNMKDGLLLNLPPEPLYLGAMRGKKQLIFSDAGYEYLAKNPVEAKYIIYAHLNKKEQIIIPNKTFITFKVVKKYEIFMRDLQKKLIHLLIRRIKDKKTAEKLAEKYFKEAKLPWSEINN